MKYVLVVFLVVAAVGLFSRGVMVCKKDSVQGVAMMVIGVSLPCSAAFVLRSGRHSD